jgi:class 3 adenylate cyclase/tetratricopeptide (TPR) repeat protein
MECPKCQFENQGGSKFCGSCGSSIEIKITCGKCGLDNLDSYNFCNECGHDLPNAQDAFTEIESKGSIATEKKEPAPSKKIIGERKHVTILFSDMSGYTSMSEKLDPEEVKEITGRIFGETAKIISKYEGFVEKYIGDAVVAIFGATKSFEDDPIRAIKAAMEIRNFVNKISPEYENKIDQKLSMHSGINTGLVVTGEIDLEKGIHGLAGDTINLAARLSSLGNKNDILVGQETYIQAEGFFDFGVLEPTKVKGKSEPINVYKVISIKEHPKKVHRLQGVRAKLVGRKVEMDQLKEGITRLLKNEGMTISICGTAGTGKSRLVEEFKSSLDINRIQWLEAHAYPYAQNIPYFPLINMLSQTFGIDEGDSPEKVKTKLESGLSLLVETEKDVIPYIGSLYSLSYPEVDKVSPEYWQINLQKAVQGILLALAKKGPTVICLEDIHWADPSFLELIRHIIPSFRGPVLFLCIYRPTVTLFSNQQINSMFNSYQETSTQDLSPSESQDMVESLLKTENIPYELQNFIQGKVEGNPFYIEELINSLVESKTIIYKNDKWIVIREISDFDIPSTIHGVISARLDRLEIESKKILQEASVIGRAFYHEIINKISEVKSNINSHLNSLERLDLIKTKSIHPDIEYIFKHALTQDVVYNGLLKKERQVIHERVGLVMERLFQDRLAEFYEILAYHFSLGHSTLKAVNYLVESGDKSLKRYSLEESDQYFSDAFNILSHLSENNSETNEILIDLLNRWALVFYYQGNFKKLASLLSAHEGTAEKIIDIEKTGMFYAWRGHAFWELGDYDQAYDYLQKSRNMGKNSKSDKVYGYACCWLAFACAEKGMFEEGIKYGIEGERIAKTIETDHYLYFKSVMGISFNHFLKGDSDRCINLGKKIVKYGRTNFDSRSIVYGYVAIGQGILSTGDFSLAIEKFKKASDEAIDPFYSNIAQFGLFWAYLQAERVAEAEAIYGRINSFCSKFGCDQIGSSAKALYCLILIEKGKMTEGMELLKDCRQNFYQQNRKGIFPIVEYVIGRVYLEIIKGEKRINIISMLKNLGFIIKHVPNADKLAQEQFQKAKDLAIENCAEGLLGQIYLDFGILHKIKKRYDPAREYLEKAIQIFEISGAYVFLKQAREELNSLG